MKKSELRRMIKEELGKATGKEYTGGADTCICPKCGYKEDHLQGIQCNKYDCPKCGTKLTGQGASGEIKKNEAILFRNIVEK